MYQAVLDTNILVAAFRSNLGASYRLLTLLGNGRWRPNLTAALLLEYEEVLKHHAADLGRTLDEIDRFLDALASQCGLHRLYYLWRPVASDPDDDLVFEAAISSYSDYNITFNKRDFKESNRFGIICLDPREFLIMMGELS